jgi:hypothetical protein
VNSPLTQIFISRKDIMVKLRTDSEIGKFNIAPMIVAIGING